MNQVFFGHRRIQKQTWLGLLFVMLFTTGGCTHIFFFPTHEHAVSPAYFGLEFENVYIPVEPRVRLHGWFIPALGESPQGTVLFLHGNGENISTHIGSVFWMPARGFNVFLYDFRGYARSGGRLNLPKSIEDVHTVIDYVRSREEVRGRPLFVLGQSLGGAIAVNAIDGDRYHGIVDALILDSPFSNFRLIAREKLAQSWLFWLFQYPLSWLITAEFNPVDAVGMVSPIPVLVVHGTADRVIPYHHGRAVFEAASEPKRFWKVPGGKHTSFTSKEAFRQRFIEYLNER